MQYTCSGSLACQVLLKNWFRRGSSDTVLWSVQKPSTGPVPPTSPWSRGVRRAAAGEPAAGGPRASAEGWPRAVRSRLPRPRAATELRSYGATELLSRLCHLTSQAQFQQNELPTYSVGRSRSVSPLDLLQSVSRPNVSANLLSY
jgi:hypothetical protein